MEEEKPDLEEMDSAPVKAWRPPKETEDLVLSALKGILPTGLRATEKILEQAYERASLLYKSGRYKDALPYFHLLSVANVKEPRYAMAVAACYHMLKNYQEAANFYMLAGFIGGESPLPFYYIADCYKKLGKPIPALATLKMALKRCTEGKSASLKSRITMMISRLEKELQAMKEQGQLTRLG